ncbi:YrhB domain-containing protein [Streptomyces sp. NPDC007907]|uniref:YrhB domain-containing protein n=1 Tax=Streptomyces sp. NPDC007907 TaxID=3364789 RepID=UPI0036E3AC41
MIEREEAVRIVQAELDRSYPVRSAAGTVFSRMVVATVQKHELVWIVSWTSEACLRTRSPVAALGGNGPYLVDRVDGGLHQIGVSVLGGQWERDYRARIRRLPVRTAVDDLHDEIRETAAADGRMRAVRTLRETVPALSPAQAVAYVGGLLDGEVPAPLAAVAVEQLVKPVAPVCAVRTVRRGDPARSA